MTDNYTDTNRPTSFSFLPILRVLHILKGVKSIFVIHIATAGGLAHIVNELVTFTLQKKQSKKNNNNNMGLSRHNEVLKNKKINKN